MYPGTCGVVPGVILGWQAFTWPTYGAPSIARLWGGVFQKPQNSNLNILTHFCFIDNIISFLKKHFLGFIMSGGGGSLTKSYFLCVFQICQLITESTGTQ